MITLNGLQCIWWNNIVKQRNVSRSLRKRWNELLVSKQAFWPLIGRRKYVERVKLALLKCWHDTRAYCCAWPCYNEKVDEMNKTILNYVRSMLFENILTKFFLFKLSLQLPTCIFMLFVSSHQTTTSFKLWKKETSIVLQAPVSALSTGT